MNKGWIYREKIKAADEGQTVLEYYSQKYSHSNRAEWQARITSEQILLNSSPTDLTAIIHRGDRLEYHRPPWNEPEVPLEFKILYEDQDLLVIDKPSGLPIMPGGGFLENTLLWQLKKDYSQDPPTPIHRLGRGTSGLMLLGRSPLAKSSLAQQMRHSTSDRHNHKIGKVYRVLVQGNSISDRLQIEQPIGKIAHPVLGYVYGAISDGKPAYSESRVIQRYDRHTLLEVTIFTGRPHQIRIHMASVGYPLLGDPLYISGGTFAPISSQEKEERSPIPVPGDCGYYLHAYRLSFVHPRSQKKVSFECPTPSTWDSLITQD
ncbi:MAG: RluA family pseudouridine synthase [Cyanobacteria bacterium P01_G01_bin.19]